MIISLNRDSHLQIIILDKNLSWMIIYLNRCKSLFKDLTGD